MKNLIVLSLFLVISCSLGAQNITGYGKIFKRNNIAQRKPIPYPKIREADVIWAKLLWREINLREKMNLSFYFPETPIDGRYSLTQLIIKGIEDNKICAFGTDDDEFRSPIELDEIKTNCGASRDTITLTDPDTGEQRDTVIVNPPNTADVKSFLVKELWYFDKQTSTMQVRILAICPVREFTKPNDDTIYKMKLCWLNYEECRDLLAKHEVYNNGNDALRVSYDDIFIKRMFSSIIIAESNVYNNREISRYASGFDAMLESERIKNEMFNWEQDLWQY